MMMMTMPKLLVIDAGFNATLFHVFGQCGLPAESVA